MLLGVGVSATIGQLFLTKAFAAGPPARVSVVMLSQVGFTMLLEMAIWHRSFSGQTLVGIFLVIAPPPGRCFAVSLRPRSKKSRSHFKKQPRRNINWRESSLMGDSRHPTISAD